MKTRDGVNLMNILKIAVAIGAGVREGTKHPYVLNFADLRPCPVAESSDARRMIAPWIAQATNKNKTEVYQAMRQGYWR